jgi:hypothetical protein
MEVSGQIHVPPALPSLNRRLCGFQNLPGSLGEKKNILPKPGKEPLTVHTIALKYIYVQCPLKNCRILRHAVLTVTDVL